MEYKFKCLIEDCDGELVIHLEEGDMFFAESIDFGFNIFNSENIEDYGNYVCCPKCGANMELNK